MRILITGDTLDRYTGLGSCALKIADFFKGKGNEVEYLIISPESSSSNSGYSHFDVDLQNCASTLKISRIDINNPESTMKEIVERFKPEKILAIHDPWWFDFLVNSKYRQSFELIFYPTIETPDYPTYLKQTRNNKIVYLNLHRILSECDILIPVTKPAQDWYSSIDINSTSHVYLGVDNIVPEPITREELFGIDDKSAFVFFTMGVNIHRKMLGRTIKIFAEFIRKNKNKKYYLVIHTNVNAGNSTDLVSLIDKLNIKDSVIISKDTNLSKQTIYAMYKHSDCYLGLTGGEGFGYGFAESMVNGLPIIYSNYGCHNYMCKDIGIPVDISDKIYLPGSAIEVGLCDIQHSIKTMEKVANNSKLRSKCIESGLSFAKSELDWNANLNKIYNIVNRNYGTPLCGLPIWRV
jgi:glycosyltransferase involved in cell wall biosynthesis